MKQFEVEMKCVITKSVTAECETEEQARNNPWDHAVAERETGMDDWEVTSVSESE